MKLYHGGYNRIEHPNCLAGRDNLDFGKGFYTTLIREHAEQWAKQVSPEKSLGEIKVDSTQAPVGAPA